MGQRAGARGVRRHQCGAGAWRGRRLRAVWAIGTGRAATPEQANSIIGGVVRAALADLYGDDVAQAMIIQYGGSIKPSNVRELMEQPEIDGGLVGGASQG